jgi:hypothetical protein
MFAPRILTLILLPILAAAAFGCRATHDASQAAGTPDEDAYIRDCRANYCNGTRVDINWLQNKTWQCTVRIAYRGYDDGGSLYRARYENVSGDAYQEVAPVYTYRYSKASNQMTYASPATGKTIAIGLARGANGKLYRAQFQVYDPTLAETTVMCDPSSAWRAFGIAECEAVGTTGAIAIDPGVTSVVTPTAGVSARDVQAAIAQNRTFFAAYNADAQAISGCMSSGQRANWSKTMQEYYCSLPGDSRYPSANGRADPPIRTCFTYSVTVGKKSYQQAYDYCSTDTSSGRAYGMTHDGPALAWVKANQDAVFRAVMIDHNVQP